MEVNGAVDQRGITVKKWFLEQRLFDNCRKTYQVSVNWLYFRNNLSFLQLSCGNCTKCMSYAPLPFLLLWLQMLKIENKKWKYVNIWWHIVIIWRAICWYDVMGMSIIYNLGLWIEIEHRYVQQTCIRKINGSDDISQFLLENDWSRMTKLTLYLGISNFLIIGKTSFIFCENTLRCFV